MDAVVQLTHAAPANQPQSVSEIAARLLPPYTVDGGRAYLAGCQLEDRPFLRLDFHEDGVAATRFFTMQGKPLAPSLVTELGLCHLIDLARPPQRIDHRFDRDMHAAIEAASRLDAPPGGRQLISTAAVWCKHTDGKLRFAAGDASADLPFQGWACSIEPPPYICPVTGKAAFHLAATDDGRLVAAEQLECCAETGRLLVGCELVTCAATGMRVAVDQTKQCPVCGERVLARTMIRCRTCRQEVGPCSMTKDVCLACRRLQKVRKADPRMARLLDEYPTLDRWNRWRIAETAEVYILSCHRWLTRLLLVVDKETLQFRSMATGLRLLGLRPIPPEQYEYVLRD